MHKSGTGHASCSPYVPVATRQNLNSGLKESHSPHDKTITVKTLLEHVTASACQKLNESAMDTYDWLLQVKGKIGVHLSLCSCASLAIILRCAMVTKFPYITEEENKTCKVCTSQASVAAYNVLPGYIAICDNRVSAAASRTSKGCLKFLPPLNGMCT